VLWEQWTVAGLKEPAVLREQRQPSMSRSDVWAAGAGADKRLSEDSRRARRECEGSATGSRATTSVAVKAAASEPGSCGALAGSGAGDRRLLLKTSGAKVSGGRGRRAAASLRTAALNPTAGKLRRPYGQRRRRPEAVA
jgi:hypothetical protein